MDDTLYELYKKRTKYRALRENVSNAINVLSRNSISNNLSNVHYTLENNYLVNEVACKGVLIDNVKDNMANYLNDLNLCLSSINSKLYSINQEIEKKEAEGSV